MMRRLLFWGAIILALGCLLLLQNITARNPTGRRYASAMTAWTNNGACDGKAAENILARDLNLVHNEKVEKTQCVCRPNLKPDALPAICGVCSAYSQHVSPSQRAHVPDFVSSYFIADAKCVAKLPTNSSQLDAFADMSAQLGVPFWIFVRVDTEVAARYLEMTRATGGDVVRYFLVPGYIDPVDIMALAGLALAILLLVALFYTAYRRPSKPTTPHKSPLSKAESAMQETEDFKNRIKTRARIEIDIIDGKNGRKH